MDATIARMKESEARAWVALVSVAELLPSRLDAQLLKQADLTHFEYSVLCSLRSVTPDAMRMGCLASTLACAAPKLSKAIGRLEKRGLVERNVGADDRRAINVEITRSGRKLWLAATPPHLEFVRDTLLAGLDDEQLEALAELLGPVIERLGAPTES